MILMEDQANTGLLEEKTMTTGEAIIEVTEIDVTIVTEMVEETGRSPVGDQDHDPEIEGEDLEVVTEGPIDVKIEVMPGRLQGNPKTRTRMKSI